MAGTVLLVSFIMGSLGGAIVGAVVSVLALDGKLPILTESTTNTGTIQGSLAVVEDSATTDVVKKADPSVVSIVLTQNLPRIRETNPFEDFFFGPREEDSETEQRPVGAGSGFIISSDGLILTNRHVVNSENVDFTVIFNDGSEHPATVLGTDPFNDLAVLKIEGKNLPVVELGDSDALQLGETVIAIGNALGEFRNTVTKGVVSGINRTITAGDSRGGTERIEGAIQTDAAINSGNSGGPLLNLAGQVVGVNTAVSQEGQSVGFSIPINIAKQVIESVQQYGKIVRPYIGVRYVLVNESVQKANNLSVDYGALIIRGDTAAQLAVIPGSPADKAGIEENDIILEYNGGKIDQNASLASYLRKSKIGDVVKLKVLHDGDEKEVSVTLEAYDQKG